MVNEETNSDNNNGDPTIDLSSSEANTSKLLGQDDDISDADPDDDIEIDTTATANARKRRTIKHRKLSKTKQRLLWRRSKVAEYLSCGTNLMDISRIMKIPYQTLYQDLTFMRQEAKDKIDSYISHLPFEVRIAVDGLNKILHNLYAIQDIGVAKMEGRHVSETSRIQALSTMKDVIKMKMDILTNTTTLSQALEFIEDRKSEIRKYHENIGKIASEDRENTATINEAIEQNNTSIIETLQQQYETEEFNSDPGLTSQDKDEYHNSSI
jgi:hypothetical protein